jgi:hypothetical protein
MMNAHLWTGLFLLAGATLSLLGACGPDASRSRGEPAAAREYTAAQKEALTSAGNGIVEGMRLYKAVPPAQRLVLDEVGVLVPEVDVVACLDRAAIVISARRHKRLEVPKPAYVAAFSVAASAREPWFQTVPNLIQFCDKMSTELSKSGFVLPEASR